MMNSKRGQSKGVVVFDLDGTLCNTAEDIAYAINYLRKNRGNPPLSTPEVLKAVGRGAPFLIQTLFSIDKNDKDNWRPLLDDFQTYYLQHQGERSRLYPGIRQVIAELAMRYDLYVLSNKPHEATLGEVEKHGIAEFFREVWGAGVFEHLKPNPIGIITALERSGVPIEKGVMVGDLTIDIESGNNAGVHTIFVSWGFGHPEDVDIEPSATIDTASELVNTIDGYLQIPRP